MKRARHCQLCNHHIKDWRLGYKCGLTNEKPEFDLTCPVIKLGQHFESKVIEVNKEHEILRRLKGWTVVSFLVYVGIGVALIISGFLLGKYAWSKGLIALAPFIISGSGLWPITLGLGIVVKHRQKLKVAQIEKENLDEVLKLYNIRYEIDMMFGKERHGVQDFSADLRVDDTGSTVKIRK